MTETTTTLHDRLRTWARGSLPLMATVEFVLAVGTDLGPMVCDDGDWAYLDLFELEDDVWQIRVGGMSGGQRATWELARSIAEGEIYDQFWRLDNHRKAAFLTALAGHP